MWLRIGDKDFPKKTVLRKYTEWVKPFKVGNGASDIEFTISGAMSTMTPKRITIK